MQKNDIPLPVYEKLERIAKMQVPCLETLETRYSDSLDFHDVSASTILSMLFAAYVAGHNSATLDLS